MVALDPAVRHPQHSASSFVSLDVMHVWNMRMRMPQADVLVQMHVGSARRVGKDRAHGGDGSALRAEQKRHVPLRINGHTCPISSPQPEKKSITRMTFRNVASSSLP